MGNAILALVVLFALFLAYLYGASVGLRHGKRIGAARSDREWANKLEHGAVSASW